MRANMKSVTISLMLLGAALGSTYSSFAVAQTTVRLARPFEPSTAGPDGRLRVNRNATMGNMVVDQYSRFGVKISAAGSNRKYVVEALKPLMCESSGSGSMVANELADILKKTSKDERARLKARDPASLTTLSITLIAAFDGVSGDAIRADEALGPGVYHDAIDGFRVALEVCDFLGKRREL